MNTEQLRAEFEAWIASPPYEKPLGTNPEASGFPGQYRAYEVQLAWEAYQAGRAALQSQMAEYIRGLARDAARYRLLRRKVCLAGGEFHILNLDPRYIAQDSAAELDAAIDAAMQRTSGGDHADS